MGRLDSLDLTQRLARKDYDERLLPAQRRLLHLRLHVGGQMGSFTGPVWLLGEFALAFSLRNR